MPRTGLLLRGTLVKGPTRICKTPYKVQPTLVYGPSRSLSNWKEQHGWERQRLWLLLVEKTPCSPITSPPLLGTWGTCSCLPPAVDRALVSSEQVGWAKPVLISAHRSLPAPGCPSSNWESRAQFPEWEIHFCRVKWQRSSGYLLPKHETGQSLLTDTLIKWFHAV